MPSTSSPRAAVDLPNISVQVMPGQRQFTVMPCGAISTAKQREKWIVGGLAEKRGVWGPRHVWPGIGGTLADAPAARRYHAPEGSLREEKTPLNTGGVAPVPILSPQTG